MKARWLFLAMVMAAPAAAACSDDEGTGGSGAGEPTGCVDYSAVPSESCCSGDFAADGTCDGTMQTCSFAADIMPLFQRSCSLSASCHTGGSPKEGLYLGPTFSVTPDQAEIDMVHAGIVGVASMRSALNLVEPGDPGASWLQAKMEFKDFDVCASVACNNDTGCGERMPQGAQQMKPHERAVFAAWIADGAGNN